MPPQLPPRSPSVSSVSSFSSSDGGAWTPPRYRTNTVHLTPHTTYPSKGSTSPSSSQNNPYPSSTGLDDPRSSSTQSLRPTESAGPDRRTLLIVYIHGFMGTETSFKSFPAHVHNVLSISLADSHVVHTKIYPRYQSRKNISFARDAFSNWLAPHESDNTDIILIGHSLGGILAAEVVLLPSHRPGSKDLFQHKILGHIAFDTPFLGMHPGVITTGIASLFKSAPELPEPPATSENSTSSPLSFDPFQAEPNDPNYNPTYDNDVAMANRKGTVDKAFYFLNKHYGQWRKATASYIKSHLEFGGCLADYDGLKKRYKCFRPLEDVDDLGQARSPSGKKIPRVRFVNYYTASTGRIKPQKLSDENRTLVAQTDMTSLSPSANHPHSTTSSHPSTPTISIEEHHSGGIVSRDLDDLHLHGYDSNNDQPEMQHLDPQAEPPSPTISDRNSSVEQRIPLEPIQTNLSLESEIPSISSIDSASVATPTSADLPLPPLPASPVAPPPFDPAPYTTADPSTLKLAKKEHERLVKSYERAKKDHEKLVRNREKHLAKLEKARQQKEKERAKEMEKEKEREKKKELENAGLSQHEINERERLKKEAERMQKEKERLEGRMQETPAPKTPAQEQSAQGISASDQHAKDEKVKRAATLNTDVYDAAMIKQQEEEDKRVLKQNKKAAKKGKDPTKQKDRKFCALPPKDPKTGAIDSTWIRVYMENMDEVVAHTSLFFVGETYAKLVGDTAQRIEQWVRDAATIRVIKQAQEWETGK